MLLESAVDWLVKQNLWYGAQRQVYMALFKAPLATIAAGLTASGSQSTFAPPSGVLEYTSATQIVTALVAIAAVVEGAAPLYTVSFAFSLLEGVTTPASAQAEPSTSRRYRRTQSGGDGKERELITASGSLKQAGAATYAIRSFITAPLLLMHEHEGVGTVTSVPPFGKYAFTPHGAPVSSESHTLPIRGIIALGSQYRLVNPSSGRVDPGLCSYRPEIGSTSLLRLHVSPTTAEPAKYVGLYDLGQPNVLLALWGRGRPLSPPPPKPHSGGPLRSAAAPRDEDVSMSLSSPRSGRKRNKPSPP